MKPTAPPNFYVADVGSGSFRAGYSSEAGICIGVGNYPGAEASTPSVVSLAPSRLIYEPQEEGPAKPVSFGHAEPLQHQEVVENVKLAILADRKAYEYAYSLLDSASKRLRLESVEQITEDFLRLLVAHVISEGGGQPTKGWVFSVPQCYSVTDVQRYRRLIQRAGAIGSIHIYGESDSVMNASMEWIKNFTCAEQQAAFKQGRNCSVAAAVCDFGDGTTDLATANISFHVDGTPPTMEEKRAPLGFGIGGNAFDGRFVDVLCAKLGLDLPSDRKQHTFLAPFIDHFRRKSKPRWPKSFQEVEYPFSTKGRDPFVLTRDDMAAIMDPPIAEICHRIGQHLSGLILQVVIAVGGNSEVPGMVPHLTSVLKEKGIIQRDEQVMHLKGQTDAVIQGLHYWTNHPRLFRGRYARVSLAREVLRDIKELPANIRSKVPSDDAKVEGYYRCAQRIMTEGDLAPDGTESVDIFYDIDHNAQKVDIKPLIMCLPDKGSESYISGPDTWNFASECQPVGAVEISPLLEDIKVAELKAYRAKDRKMKRRLWLRLSIAVGVDIAITMSWRHDGRRIKVGADISSAELALNLELPGGRLTNEFRAPIRPRESSGANISHDILPLHLQMLRSISHATLPREAHPVITPAPSDRGSSASIDDDTFPGCKRSFAKAMGGDEGSQARRPALFPQDFPHGSRGQFYQHGVCPTYLPPTHSPLSAQTLATNIVETLLSVASQRPEPAQAQESTVTGSQATLDMVNMAATSPPLGTNHFYPSEMRTLNRPPGSENHIYPGSQQHPIRVTGDGTTSMDLAQLTSTHGGYDGSQILQGVVPQSMPSYSQTPWTHEQPVRGYGSGYIAGTQFQESSVPAGDNVGGSSLWPPASGAQSWEDYRPAAPNGMSKE